MRPAQAVSGILLYHFDRPRSYGGLHVLRPVGVKEACFRGALFRLGSLSMRFRLVWGARSERLVLVIRNQVLKRIYRVRRIWGDEVMIFQAIPLWESRRALLTNLLAKEIWKSLTASFQHIRSSLIEGWTQIIVLRCSNVHLGSGVQGHVIRVGQEIAASFVKDRSDEKADYLQRLEVQNCGTARQPAS